MTVANLDFHLVPSNEMVPMMVLSLVPMMGSEKVKQRVHLMGLKMVLKKVPLTVANLAFRLVPSK